MFRRDFLRVGSLSLAAVVPSAGQQDVSGLSYPKQGEGDSFNVRSYGATGDGMTIDSTAINRAIQAASASGGGTVRFPAGRYLCYTLRLKSSITLQLDAGAILIAADVPQEGTTSGGYDSAGPAQPWEAYADFGHNHWANSLLYGDGLENVAIVGTGLIWGRGLSRGVTGELPKAESPGVGNKAIALKNCRGVVLRDFSVLMGGHFAVLLTGVDNAVVDGLTIDTNRDGIDIDCCRNVRVANCSVTSPWDDGIVPKSSYALGYSRPCENIMITNCYVSGSRETGTLMNGALKHRTDAGWERGIGRIKCGTESSGGFRNITISNCVLDSCRGLGLFSVDGGVMEDICITNITMRNLMDPPLTLRLGRRMRNPERTEPSAMRRILISNIVSSGSQTRLPSVISGVPTMPIEDVQISNIFVEQPGDSAAALRDLHPAEREEAYPDADMFGELPASGFFIRHARNLQLSNVEIVTKAQDLRAAVWASDVDGLDVFRIRTPRASSAFALNGVKNFRVSGSAALKDRAAELIAQAVF